MKRAPDDSSREGEDDVTQDALGVPEEAVCFRPTSAQSKAFLQYLEVEGRGGGRWNRTQWMRHFLELYMRLEAVLAETPTLEAYAIQERLTVPRQRRHVGDQEWKLDVLVTLARERLEQLQKGGKLGGK